MNRVERFEGERQRLVAIASRLLGDPHEAEDIVQLCWLRLADTPTEILNLPGWLTTVTTRLCLDRLRARVARPAEGIEAPSTAPGPLDVAERAEAVGQALHVVVETLTPNERVAFVLSDAFGYDFAAIGEMLGRSPAAARKLASSARASLVGAQPEGRTPDWRIVDAFMVAARGGDLTRLLDLLAPGASVGADDAARAAGTPARIDGREAVAHFFNGSAKAALDSFVEGRPGSAWFQRGEPMVAFDFTVVDGRIERIEFRADPDVLSRVVRRDGADPKPDAPRGRASDPV